MTVWQDKTGKYNRTWIYKFQHQGRQYFKSGFETKREAAAAESEHRKSLKNPSSETSITLSELCEMYLDHCQGRFRHNTIRQKIFVYRSMIRFIGSDMPCDAIKPRMVEAYLASQLEARGPKAANRDLRDIKALFAWAAKHDLCAVPGIRLMDPYPEGKTIKYVPPVEDFNRVLMVAHGDDRDLLLVLYHTAGRRGEILERLSWEDVNFEGRYVRLHTRKRKGGSMQGRTVPMNETLYEVLWRRWQNRRKDSPFVFTSSKTGGRYSREAKKGLMTRLCRQAGVKPFTMHAIRHLVASILSDSHKASPRQIQSFLGHQRIDTTENYLHEIRPMDDVAGVLDTPAEPHLKNKNRSESRSGSRGQ